MKKSELAVQAIAAYKEVENDIWGLGHSYLEAATIANLVNPVFFRNAFFEKFVLEDDVITIHFEAWYCGDRDTNSYEFPLSALDEENRDQYIEDRIARELSEKEAKIAKSAQERREAQEKEDREKLAELQAKYPAA